MGRASHLSTNRRIPAQFVVSWFAVCLLVLRLVAQEEATRPPEHVTQDATAQSIAKLEDLVAKSEALLKGGDPVETRAVCRAAIAGAQAEWDKKEWLAAAHKVLWRLGLTAYRAGDLRSAHEAWHAVHRHLEATLPDDDAALLRARTNLAIVKRSLGDLRGALSLQEMVIAVRSKTQPDDHPDLQTARLSLAGTLKELGDLQGALALEETVLAVRQRTLPDDHYDLQVARLSLASSRKELGDPPGALALEEKVLAVFSRTLPDDHSSMLVLLANLAVTKKTLGDLRGALALEERVLAARSTTLPDDHPDLQMTRLNLASTKSALGDKSGALSLQEKVFAVRSETLPDDHRDLQKARLSLAEAKLERGDMRAAFVLQEKVLAVWTRTLPDDHPDLQWARSSLATTKLLLGDIPGALALQEKVYAVRSRMLPDDHPNLQETRLNLATTKYAFGDLPGALSLQEKVLVALSRTLPDDHRNVQAARHGLAMTRRDLGDLPGALVLEEKVLAVWSTTLPDDHPDLQTARASLAITKKALGDLRGALSLEEKVLEVFSTLPEEDFSRQTAYHNLAITKHALGDLSGALALQERVFEVLSKTLPDDHPGLQEARASLAITKKALGDMPGALALQEQVVAVRSKTLPDDHPDLQMARHHLATTKWALGDLRVAAQLDCLGLAGALRRLSSQCVSMRAVVELARQAAEPLSNVNSGLDLGDRLPLELAAELRFVGLQMLEATRSAELHTARLQQVVRSEHPEAFARLAASLAEANRLLADAITLPVEGRTTPEGTLIAREDAIRDATVAKDVLERELLALVPNGMRVAVAPSELAAQLEPHEVAVSFLVYSRHTNDPDKPWITTSERRYGAYVLTADGAIRWHSLAPSSVVDALIVGIRSDALAARQLAPRSNAADLQPGRDPDAAKAPAAMLVPRLGELRALLFDPILAALPEGTDTLTLSLADELQLVPIEALPLAGGQLLGEALRLQQVWALRVLLDDRVGSLAPSTALVLGGVDYDARPDTAASLVPAAATPIFESITVATEARGGHGPHSFVPLPGTRIEAETLAASFAKAFPDRSATLLLDALASEVQFVEAATGKTFLHLATHGYFAPESVWARADQKDSPPLARFNRDRDNHAAQLSPYSLAGIALAGANLPPDELGRREGILTAQEIVHFDLRGCELATLSACQTSLGVRRAGSGLASLRQAFHAAGVRFVLATLWEVNDVEAEKLMADFYERLWQKRQGPNEALRGSKQAAKARGVPFRDWAGWVLSGR